jgi:hypothetical protein
LLLHYDLSVVEQSPLPPHERSWRHPSELAAEERSLARAEPMPTTSRVFALTTGTAGLVAIALLFVMVTPSRDAQPVAVSGSTEPAALDGADTTASVVAARSAPDNRLPEALPTTAALATPIGSGQYALVLRASLTSAGAGPVELVLPSGRVTSGEVVDTGTAGGDTVLVHVRDREPGHEVADHRPHERDVVIVMANPPVEVALADLGELEVAEGTAVVDADGHLVGLCGERRGGGVRLVEVPNDVTDIAQP